MSRRTLFLFLCSLLALHGLDARLYFIHIPKTGGTTLRLLLESQLSLNEIYPARTPNQSTAKLSHALVSGHIPYWFCKKLDPYFGESFKVTILRDPIERYLSHLRVLKKANPTLPDLESVLKLRQGTIKKYQKHLMDNCICRSLAKDPQLEGNALLESAKRSLQDLDCVLFFDNFTQDVIDLFLRLGITLSEHAIPTINFSEKVPVSEALIEEIKKLHVLDIQLYQYAKEHIHPKSTLYSFRTQSFDKVSQRTNLVDYSFDLPLDGRGWNYREADSSAIYRWVTNLPAYIYFSLEQDADYDLSFQARPLTAAISPRVCVNGKEVGLCRFDTREFSTYHGKIPQEWITNSPTELCFFSLESAEYRELYPDGRHMNDLPLSFAVNRIQIYPFHLNGTQED